MDKTLGISIAIGATASAALSAFGSVKRSIVSLGEASSLLKAKQNELGAAIERHMGTLAPKTLAAMNREYQKLGRTIEQISAKQEKLNRLQNTAAAWKATRADLRGQIGETAALAIGAAMPLKLAIDFESAMADVRKVVDFETPAEFLRFGDTIKAMSRDIPIAATGLAQIAASGGQLGIKQADLPDFTRTVAKMSTAFDMMPEEAGDSMAKLANAYNLPIKEIGRLGDAINHLSNNSPAKARDLVGSMGRVAGVAKTFGLTEVQTAALTNAFISLGKPPEVAATAINGLLQKLGTADKQGPKFQKALADIGTDATTMKKLIENDAQGALLTFFKAIEKMPKGEQMGTLVDMFGLEYSDDVAALAGSLEQYVKSVNLVANQKNFAGSMDKEFQERANTTANRLQLFKNSLVELGIGVGETLRPALNELLDSVTPWLHSTTQWVSQNQGLVRSLAGVLVGVAGLKVGALGLRYAWALGGSGITSLMTAFHGLGARFLFVRSMFVAGAPRMMLLFRVLGAGEGSAAKLAAGLGKLGGWIGSAGSAAFKLGSTLRGPLLGGLRLAGQAVLWLGRALFMNPIGWAVTAIAGGAYLIYRNWDRLKPWFAGLWSGIRTVIGSAWNGIKMLFFNFTPLGIIIRNWSPIRAWLANLMASVRGLSSGFFKAGGDLIDGLIGGVKAKLGEALDTIGKFAGEIKSRFAALLGIKSPSRVFMGYGDNVVQGAALGIARSTPQASQAAASMAQSTLAAASKAGVPSSAGNRAAAGAGNAGGGVVIHLNQTFNLEGGGKDVKTQIQEATQITLREFERLMSRYMHDKQRRGYA